MLFHARWSPSRNRHWVILLIPPVYQQYADKHAQPPNYSHSPWTVHHPPHSTCSHAAPWCSNILLINKLCCQQWRISLPLLSHSCPIKSMVCISLTLLFFFFYFGTMILVTSVKAVLKNSIVIASVARQAWREHYPTKERLDKMQKPLVFPHCWPGHSTARWRWAAWHRLPYHSLPVPQPSCSAAPVQTAVLLTSLINFWFSFGIYNPTSAFLFSCMT